jgi:hypothetical protein
VQFFTVFVKLFAPTARHESRQITTAFDRARLIDVQGAGP